MRRKAALRTAHIVAIAFLGVMAGCGPVAPGDAAPPAPVTARPVATQTPSATPSRVASPKRVPRKSVALAVLGRLAVKGREPRTGYERALFGQSWRDLDRNGCDQRNDVLRRDLRKFTLKIGTHGCLVLAGTLISPYTGQTIHFVRGQATSSEVQIDHIVALSDAWQKGAQRWSTQRREEFANDFLELRAVDGHSNGSKGDGDAATWLPPRKDFRCGYVATQIAVKQKYGLWVTPAERDAMARVLSACPHQQLPRSYAIRLGD